MIKWIIAIVALAAAAGYSQPQPAKPVLPLLPDSVKVHAKTTKSRLSFGQTVFDFGQVPRTTKLHHLFKYGVSSLDTVKIIRSASSFGCTFAKMPSKPLPPGDTGSIAVTCTTTHPNFSQKHETKTKIAGTNVLPAIQIRYIFVS